MLNCLYTHTHSGNKILDFHQTLKCFVRGRRNWEGKNH